MFNWILNSNGSQYPNPEQWDIQTSNAQVKGTKPLGDVPLVVISQSLGNPLFMVNIPPSLTETNAKLHQIWHELRRELVGLSSNSAQIIAAQAGHNNPNDDLELIVEAIRQPLQICPGMKNSRIAAPKA